MKEIIYIQAGNLSNYAGTHFWNTQETYLAEETADSPYDFDVSFREGLSPTGRPTICPRLLVFDTKANFGTLAKSNALLGTNEDELPSEDFPVIWNGGVTEYRQDPIPESAYHSSLEKAEEEEDDEKIDDTDGSREDVRYWSDFNRLYYIPRTVQPLPDPAEWENPEGDWNLGQSLFSRYDEDQGLMEGSVRLFLEECDSPQGIQVINDTPTFGGFINSFLTSFRDQYLKIPCLVFPLLSDAVSKRVVPSDDSTGTRKIINDALYLRSLDELASMSVPIQLPNAWPTEAWCPYLTAELNNTYHVSAILSAHVETSTLPLRLKGRYDDLGTVANRLNWRGTTRFSELSGIFPFNSAEDFERRLVNFSAGGVEHGAKHHQFTRLDVTRGFSPSGLSAYEQWSAGRSLQDAYISRIHAPPYPIPTSYPAFFKPADDGMPARKGIFAQPVQTSVFSSLSTSTQTAHLFSSYAAAIEAYLKRKPTDQALGFENDELRDLVNDLWTLHDNFNDGGEDGESSLLGEDEE
ncbi:putative tubulin domain containing protein [Lyophyllum shimeji]|uniref:Tubulin domain containing protein n=1 Tax=Lyophyllum shimeji TaxID=47721 RepID=A0A9P3UX25_LYOSH|nr:putative tubulin domain containing protein [Lyophyllum shimeji]